jgi:membrane-associated phospholipid phosphatase
MESWEIMSAAGELVVTCTLAGGIAAALAARRAWRRLQCWCLLFGAAMALVVASKLAFLGWGLGVPALHFTGISGHAARAAAVFPALAWLLMKPGRRRRAAVAAAALLGLLVGVARVRLEAHSASEVLAGCLLGWSVAAVFIWQARGWQPPRRGPAQLAVCLPLLLLLGCARPAPTQVWLRSAALYLAGREPSAVRAPDWTGQPASRPDVMFSPPHSQASLPRKP